MHDNKDIDIVISKFIRGEAIPEEAMMLEDWKNASAENKKHYKHALKIYGQDEIEVNTAVAWEGVKGRFNSTKKIRFSQVFLRIAASIVVLGGISIALISMFKSTETEKIELYAENEIKEIRMDDGTEISLAPHSSITYDEDYNIENRKIYLKGSAYFSTDSKENDIPLIVDMGGIYIKDIGTKFNIRTSSDTDTVFVHVDEGLVILFDSIGSEITIRASEGAIYIKSTKSIQALPIIDINKQFSFKDTPLKDVLKHLNKAYKTNITLSNAEISDLKITVSFDNENIETVLMIITETLDMRYEKTHDGYLIMNR